MPVVLLVEDSPSLSAAYAEYLRDEPVELRTAETGAEALDVFAAHNPSALILDLKLPDMSGLDVLRRVREADPTVGVIIITAHGSVNIAVEAMRAGATDFVMKPFTAERLVVTLRNVLETRRLMRLVETYRENLGGRAQYGNFIGSSLPMQAVYRMINAAAPSKATVFITGESGTGKEVCAESVHAMSPRQAKPFVALNCAAIPKDLMESEIFGHVKGAFTSAVSDRDGAATRADGGTLFLDEICELDINLQTKLLRFIQTGTFNKVGGGAAQRVDVRFICATNRDPLREVEEGRFREDLYYRLHVIPIHLPPLRERGRDVLELAGTFLSSFSAEEGKSFDGFSGETEEMMMAYEWPGNVRELQNVIRNVVVMNSGGEIGRDMLPRPLDQFSGVLRKTRRDGGSPPSAAPVASASAGSSGAIRPLWVVEKEAIENAIRLCGGNVPKAAIELGISASTIYRKMKAWEDGGEA